MGAPFEGATTRSRSQNQDATQTLRGDDEPGPHSGSSQLEYEGHAQRQLSASEDLHGDRDGSPDGSELSTLTKTRPTWVTGWTRPAARPTI